MKKLLSLVVLTGFLAVGSFANAQSDRGKASVDNTWTGRSLTPKKLQLQILAGPTSHQALSIRPNSQEFGLTIRHTHPSHTQLGLPLGLSFGVARNLEVGIGLPIYLTPSDFGDLPIWATYQFLEGSFQMGAQLTLFMPTRGDFGLQLGLPMMYSNGRVRIDTGLYALFVFSKPGAQSVYIPLRAGFQIADAVYAGVQTELRVSSHGSGSRFNMPLYGFLGYTIDGGLGPIDLGVRFGFDNFLRAGADVGNVMELRNFGLAIGANIGIQF